MAEVKNAKEAENLVVSLYPALTTFYQFTTRKVGFTWVVEYDILRQTETERHEARIDGRTGQIISTR